MGLEQLKCPACGADKLEIRLENGETIYTCGFCGIEFVDHVGIKEYEKLEATIKAGLGSVIDEALLRERTAKYYNLRSMLWGKITARYTDSAAIVSICRDILSIAQHDFLAIANSGTREEIADYISKIDETENALLIDLVLNFIIKSLKEEYIVPTAALLERCGKIFSPQKKQEFLSAFEAEAAKVSDGIYEVGLNRDVFLAYSSKDMPKVIEVLNFIESNGLTCFAAFRNLQHGRDAVANYERALEEAIDHCSIFVFISSTNSRAFTCDAFKKEIAYIRNTELREHREYRSYELLPEKYRKLRIEYRLDNKPTPLADRALKEFFAGLTYAEDYDQLIARLGECMDKLSNPFIEEEEEPAPAPQASANPFNFNDKESFAEMIRMINEENRKAEEEARRKREEEAKRKAEEEAKRKAEEEAKRRAEEEAKRKLEEEARRKAEAEARAKAEAEARIKAEAEAKRNAEAEAKRRIAEEAKRKLEEEARLKREAEAKRKADEEARIRAEAEAKRKAEEEAKRKAQEEAKRIAEAEAKRKAEVEAKRRAEAEARRRAQMEQRRKEEEEYRRNLEFTEEESRIRAKVAQSSVIRNGVFVRYNGNSDTVIIPDSVTTIGERAFDGCKVIKSVIIGSTVKFIESYAFNNCDNLKSVTFRGAAAVVGPHTFSFCPSLTDIDFGSRVYEISDHAFSSCDSLKSVTIPPSVRKIGAGVFSECKNLIEVKIDPHSEHYKNIDGNIYTKDGKVLVKYISSKTYESFTIPGTVTHIESGAFYGVTYLKTVTIPSSVTSIGNMAFYGCKNLYELKMQNSHIKMIGFRAFENCNTLKSINLPEDITNIDWYAFAGCNNLTIYLHPNTKMSEFDKTWHGGCPIHNSITGQPYGMSGMLKRMFKK